MEKPSCHSVSHTKLFLCRLCVQSHFCLHVRFRPVNDPSCIPDPRHEPTSDPGPFKACSCVFCEIRASEVLLAGKLHTPCSSHCFPNFPSPDALAHCYLESFHDIRAALTVNKFPLWKSVLRGELWEREAYIGAIPILTVLQAGRMTEGTDSRGGRMTEDTRSLWA